MHTGNYPSKLLDDAVNELSKLPGIGKRTALRLALHILRKDKEDALALGQAVIALRNETRYCKICNNISDSEVCGICANPSRDESLVCVVEDIRDIMAIEDTVQFKGKYHVLGGIISPMDGIGPGDLNIKALEEKVASGEIKEIIFALATTMEGDTTNFYLYKKLKQYPVKFSTIARGVSIGGELEYIDEVTLGRSIANRTDYESSISLG